MQRGDPPLPASKESAGQMTPQQRPIIPSVLTTAARLHELAPPQVPSCRRARSATAHLFRSGNRGSELPKRTSRRNGTLVFGNNSIHLELLQALYHLILICAVVADVLTYVDVSSRTSTDARKEFGLRNRRTGCWSPMQQGSTSTSLKTLAASCSPSARLRHLHAPVHSALDGVLQT